jgi:carboxylesterase
MSIKFHIDLRKNSKPKIDSGYVNGNGLSLKGQNNRTVILIHGLTGTPNEMKFLAQFLNKQGYSVTCPRLANHGQPLNVLKKTKWQDFYCSAREAFMEIKDNGNLIFASGLSMGALLALLLAEEFPGKIAGVSCLSPTLFYDGWNTPWSRCLLPLAYLTPIKHCFYFKEDPPYGIKNEQVRKLVHRYYSQAKFDDMRGIAQFGYPYFPVTLLYQLHLLVNYLSKKLAHIDTPVQLIQAKNDDMTSVKNSQFIYDRIASKNKEMVLLDNSYHVITADYEREKVAQEMSRFFEEVLSHA